MECTINTVKEAVVKNSKNFIIVGNEITIPYNKFGRQKAYAIARDKVKEVNKLFQSDKYGNAVTMHQRYVEGVTIKVMPTYKLKEALETKKDGLIITNDNRNLEKYIVKADNQEREDARKAEKQNEQDYLFGSRVKFEQGKKPLGDNYIELINWKETELKDVNNQIDQVKNSLRHNDTSNNRKKLKELEKEASYLLGFIQSLTDNDESYIYHAIEEDLEHIEKALDSDEIHKIQEVKNKLDLYTQFKDNLDEKDSEYAVELASKIARIEQQYTIKSVEKINKEFDESDAIQEVKDNLSLDDIAMSQLGKEVGENVSNEDLLKANKDISKVTKYGYGLITSWTGDTIIPEYIMDNMMRTVNKHENQVLNIIDTLDALAKSHANFNRESLIQLDETGTKTGWLVDVYSKEWFEALSQKSSLLSNFIMTSADKRDSAYSKIIQWHRQNANVLDFTMIPEVRLKYSNNSRFSKYFKSTDSQAASYIDGVKERLGPRYDDMVKEVLQKLEKFDEILDEGDYKEIAQNDIWEFTSRFNGKSQNKPQDPMGFTSGNSPIYFISGLKDLPLYPKKLDSQQEETGFYSEQFKQLRQDPVALEFWKSYKRMSEYIASSYNENNYGRLSYPKVEKLFAERIGENIKAMRSGKFGNLGQMFKNSLQEYKGFFYEKGMSPENNLGISANKVDRSQKVFKEYVKAKMLQGYTRDEAWREANRALLDTYSNDMDRNFKATLMAAALNNARNEVEPMSAMLLNFYKNIKDKKGNNRENGYKRLEGYVNKVIRNKSTAERGNNTKLGKEFEPKGMENLLKYLSDNTRYGKKFIEEHGLKLLSEQERLIYEEYKVLSEQLNNLDMKETITDYIDGSTYYFQIIETKDGKSYYLSDPIDENSMPVTKEEFKKYLKLYLDAKLNSIGLNSSVAGLIDGVLKTLVLKGLGLSPISGIFNRVEGMHTIMIMDLTGTYWTPGNSDIAKEMMAFANTRKMDKRFNGIVGEKRSKQLKIFEEFKDRIGGMQDRKNELQKNNESDRNRNFQGVSDFLKDIFAMAVTNPEFKNQGTVMLSVFMDMEITDNYGNTHKLLDKNTQEFTPFELDENDNLTIKEEFSETFNFESNFMEELMVKVSNAVSHSQGNYNIMDIMLAKGNIVGKVATLFKTWMPEAIYQRFGTTTDSQGGEVNVNLAFKQRQREGRYVEGFRASKMSTGIATISALGVSFGLLGGVGLIGGSIISAFVYQKYIKKIASTRAIENDVSTILKVIEFIKSILVESLNYPSRLFSSIPGMKRLRFENNTFTSDKFISFENKEGNVINLREYQELTNAEKKEYFRKATALSINEINSLKAMSREVGILLTLLMGKLAFGLLQYDDDDDEASPQRMKYNFVQNQLSKAITTLNSYASPTTFINDSSRIGVLAFLDDLQKTLKYLVFEPDLDKASNSAIGLLPIPRILTKGKAPWHEEYVYDNFTLGGLGELKWTQDMIKNKKTNGEYKAKKEWYDMRKEYANEVSERFMKISGGDKKTLSIIKSNVLDEIFGDKEDSYMNTIRNHDKTIDHKSRAKLKSKLKSKLREQGLDEETIDYITNIRFEEYD